MYAVEDPHVPLLQVEINYVDGQHVVRWLTQSNIYMHMLKCNKKGKRAGGEYQCGWSGSKHWGLSWP